MALILTSLVFIWLFPKELTGLKCYTCDGVADCNKEKNEEVCSQESTAMDRCLLMIDKKTDRVNVNLNFSSLIRRSKYFKSHEQLLLKTTWINLSKACFIPAVARSCSNDRLCGTATQTCAQTNEARTGDCEVKCCKSDLCNATSNTSPLSLFSLMTFAATVLLTVVC
ncbi:uncharacterized protein [Porites lutea]|uniref:uncharacterized protein n=1 Tax=Porites lutea TaxID=51062 RepID=UPI003CC5685C